MTYSIIITNWNGAEILKKNLPLVFDSVGKCEVVVVDDASTDDSLKVLKELQKKYKSLKVIAKEKNEGFSSTTNLGVRSAKTDLVILLNSDVIPHKGFLKTALTHFEDPSVFAVGLHDHSFEKTGPVTSRGKNIGKFIRGLVMHRPGPIVTGPNMWANGGSGIFRRDIWEKIGGLDEMYNPAYGEDWDLGYRAWKLGYKIIFEAQSEVDHHHEQGSIRNRYSAFYRRAITFRNQNLFVLKNITDVGLLIQYILFLPYHLVYKFDLAFWYGFLLMLEKVLMIKRYQPVKSDKEVLEILSKDFVLKNEEIF